MGAPPINPDSLSASPRYKQVTLATGVAVDFVADPDLGGVSRQIQLLSTATGDLTTTPASPGDGAATRLTTITNLPAGTTIGISARGISAPPAGLNGLILLVLCALALLSGCTPAAQSTAIKIAAGAEVACVLVVSVEAPGDEGLCAKGQELADAIIDYVGAHAAEKVAVTETPDGKTVVPAPVFARLKAKPELAARKFSRAKPCPKLPEGTVAP
jgi:hypothetical protein